MRASSITTARWPSSVSSASPCTRSTSACRSPTSLPAPTSTAPRSNSTFRSARRVNDLDEIEPFRRRGRPAGAPVARGERLGDMGDAPFARADELQRPDHVAHLVVQEGAGASLDDNLVAIARDREAVERLHRRLRLAQRIAEAGEVVLADEQLRRRLHRLGIEKRAHMPDAAALQHRRRPAIQNAVAIDAAARRASKLAGTSSTASTDTAAGFA